MPEHATASTADDETARALLVLMPEIQDLTEAVERVVVQVNALAERHGVPIPGTNSPVPCSVPVPCVPQDTVHKSSLRPHPL